MKKSILLILVLLMTSMVFAKPHRLVCMDEEGAGISLEITQQSESSYSVDIAMILTGRNLELEVLESCPEDVLCLNYEDHQEVHQIVYSSADKTLQYDLIDSKTQENMPLGFICLENPTNKEVKSFFLGE